jgi:hypothetical protein
MTVFRARQPVACNTDPTCEKWIAGGGDEQALRESQE